MVLACLHLLFALACFRVCSCVCAHVPAHELARASPDVLQQECGPAASAAGRCDRLSSAVSRCGPCGSELAPPPCIWPVGLMDKASASGAGDSRFESWAGQLCPSERFNGVWHDMLHLRATGRCPLPCVGWCAFNCPREASPACWVLGSSSPRCAHPTHPKHCSRQETMGSKLEKAS